MGFSELPTTPDQKWVNPSDDFPKPFQATTSFQRVTQKNILLLAHKIIQRWKKKLMKRKYIKCHKIELIAQLHVPVLPHFPRVPTGIVEQVTFNMQRQWYGFVDSPGTDIDLSYVIFHENHIKCYLFTVTCFWSQHIFPCSLWMQNL